jgi:hypothetical protein
MTWHPLDGNMIAADRHHGRGAAPEEGDRAKCCESGVLEFRDVDGCYCHLISPCSACTDNPLVCSECGEEAE